MKYAVQRILFMLLTLFIITLICFVLVRLLPPVELAPGDPHADIIRARRIAQGYGKPVLEQFVIYVKDIVVDGSWGVSDVLFPGQEVDDIFISKLPSTIIVNLYSIIFAIPIGIAFGIFAALKKNTWIDHTISTLTMVVISVPSFVYAALIQYFLYFKWGLLPAVVKDGYDYFSWEMLKSMISPVLSLSFGVIAGFTRTTRAELTEVLTSEFMLLARTKGLTKTQATIRHALKNCMVVILPSIFGNFVSILSGSLIIEKIFSVPGVGQLYINSINGRDYPMFMMLNVFYVSIGLVASIVVDLSYGLIDPRIRMGSRK